MAYKFQVGSATMVGSLTQEGAIECDTSLTIGSAALTEAELEKLDGITNGTAAANKAVVLDGSKNIATIGTIGCGAITSTGASTMGSLNIGGTLACDTSFTLDDVAINATEIGFLDSVSAGTAAASKAVVLDGSKNIATIGTIGCGAITSTGASSFGSITPASADGGALGSASKEWSDLYLADGGQIILGSDQDVKLTHDADSGVTLSTAGDGGSGPRAILTLHYDSASPADDDMVGAIKFKGDDDGGNVTSYAEITGVSKDVTNTTEDGALSFDVLVNGSPVGLVDICKTAASTVTISDGAYDFNIASHDGTNGLALAGTIVGASAAEINAACDASARTAAAVTVADDHFLFCDGGASGATKVESIADLATAQAGTGITATNGVFSVTAAQTGITSLLATDIKIGEDDQTKIDFATANQIQFYANNSKEMVLEENELSPGTNDGIALGSAAMGWSDLYLADGGQILLGNDQDVKLTHVADEGITLSTAGDGGGGPKAILNLHYDSATPADNDMCGAIKFKGDDSAGNVTSYAEITGVSKDVTNTEEDGAMSFDVLVAGSPVGMFDINKTTASTITVSDGAYNFNIASHDGTNGLALAGTVVTAAAADMNILLGCAGNGLVVADLTKLAGVDATAAEINYLDLAAAGVSAANKAIVCDGNGDFEMQDSDKIFFGSDADVSIHFDGTTMKIGTDTSGKAITIGHSTSEVTVADNLTVTGDFTVQGTTTTVNSTTIAITNSFTFEGATADAHETILGVVDPTADATLKLPALSAGTYYVPCVADAPTDASSAVTAAEFALLDGGSSVGTTALAAGDGFLHNDGGTMKHTTIEKIGDLLGGGAGLAVSSGVLSVDIDGLSALGGTGLHQTQDHFMFSDNGTEKKITFSNLQDAVFADVSGDATIAAGGALTIAATSVEGSMLNNNAISGLTDIGAAVVATDELMVSDAGTLRRTDISRLKSFINSQDVQNVDDSGTLAVGMNYWSDLGGAESATLPASPTVGDIVYVKAASNTSTTNTITISRAGSQTIDGATSIVLESPYAAVSLCYVVADAWMIF